MSKVAIVATAAAFLATTLVITGQAVAQQWRWVGPPIGERGAKWGNLCWQDKSGGGYFGYWDACPKPKKGAKKAKIGRTSLPHPRPSAAQFASKIRSSAQFGKKTKAVVQKAKDTVARKTARLPPAQLKNKADPVTEKAKASITAMMENPASAEFSKLKRAVKNLLDEPVDTICGYVKGKNASGGDTGEMPFLYMIRDGQGYLVDGRSFVAETVHGVLCK